MQRVDPNTFWHGVSKNYFVENFDKKEANELIETLRRGP